jgi:hypothetical protein
MTFEVKADPKYLAQQADLIKRYQIQIPSEFETYARFVGIFIPFEYKGTYRNTAALFSSVIDTEDDLDHTYWRYGWPPSFEELDKWIRKEIEENVTEHIDYVPHLSFNNNYITQIDPYSAMKRSDLTLEYQSKIEENLQDLIESGILKLVKQQKDTNATQKSIKTKAH